MKRFLALIGIAAIMMGVLCACGNDDNKNNGNNGSNNSNNTEQSTTMTATGDNSDNNQSNSGDLGDGADEGENKSDTAQNGIVDDHDGIIGNEEPTAEKTTEATSEN